MSKYTPGPWVHHQEDNIITTPNGLSKLLEWQARSLHVSQEERDANARLIAAAPAMLEALRKAVLLLAGVCVHSPELEPHETYEAVSAAISKATGCDA